MSSDSGAAFKAGQNDAIGDLEMNPAMQNADDAIRKPYEAGWHQEEEKKKEAFKQ